MTNKVIIGNCELYIGDCREIMKGMPDGAVDIVFTSPPYNCGLPYETYDDNLSEEEFHQFNCEWFTECVRVMAENSRMYIVCSDKLMFDLKNISETTKARFSQLLVWCKPNLSGGAGKISGDWNYLTENIILFRKGKRTPMVSTNTNTHNFFVIPSPQTNFVKDKKLHIAQFPVELPKRILSRTPGNVVMDPFMGSGTTGVACVQMNRKFIGIEIEPKYFEIAVNRIKKAQQQIRLPIKC